MRKNRSKLYVQKTRIDKKMKNLIIKGIEHQLKKTQGMFAGDLIIILFLFKWFTISQMNGMKKFKLLINVI